MRPQPRRQADLFEADRKMSGVPIAQKAILVSLIERLLVEALANEEAPVHGADDKTREATHEQDHA